MQDIKQRVTGNQTVIHKQVIQYNCCVSGHYPSSCFLFKIYNVSETGFCLHLHVKPTQLGPIDRASPYLRSGETQ
jgi:hypothetical protein